MATPICDDCATAGPAEESVPATSLLTGSYNAATVSVALPRIVIHYCRNCQWLLRAAYYGQELLSTFGSKVGELALTPATGGNFTVTLTYECHDGGPEGQPLRKDTAVIWDRKTEGGFPETKILKQRVRDLIEPDRKLGHSDRGAEPTQKLLANERAHTNK